MSKPMLVTVPFLLLLVDLWPLGRAEAGPDRPTARTLAWLALEKAPLVAMSAAASAVTWLVQSRAGAAAALAVLPLRERLANALWSYAAYLGRALVPVELAAFYPHPAIVGDGTPGWKVGLALAVLGAATWLAIGQRLRRPQLAFGWFWYLGAAFPVIGIVQVGAQAMADRYTYLPMLGPAIAVAWTAGELAASSARARRLVAAASAAALLALAALAARQVGTWRDGFTLNTHALAVTERNWQAWIGLGDALLDRGRASDALDAYRRAIGYVPAAPEAWNGMGVALGALDRDAEAIGAFERALGLRPAYPHAWYNLGTAHGRAGRPARAAECFREALRLRPDDERAWGNLAVASAALGDAAEAARALDRLAALAPQRAAQLRRDLGVF
jgi:tetratricopeptide (TPR) repeat protein